MSAVLPTDSTYSFIEKKVRHLTASGGQSSITSSDVQQAINTFYNNDFPYAIKIDQQRTVYKFLTIPYAAIPCNVTVSDTDTSSFPENWDDPIANVDFAIEHFIEPALNYWHGLQRYSGDDLIRLVAATYNAGLGGAIKGHEAGNVDLYTTDGYAGAVLGFYQKLSAGLAP